MKLIGYEWGCVGDVGFDFGWWWCMGDDVVYCVDGFD